MTRVTVSKTAPTSTNVVHETAAQPKSKSKKVSTAAATETVNETGAQPKSKSKKVSTVAATETVNETGAQPKSKSKKVSTAAATETVNETAVQPKSRSKKVSTDGKKQEEGAPSSPKSNMRPQHCLSTSTVASVSDLPSSRSGPTTFVQFVKTSTPSVSDDVRKMLESFAQYFDELAAEKKLSEPEYFKDVRRLLEEVIHDTNIKLWQACEILMCALLIIGVKSTSFKSLADFDVARISEKENESTDIVVTYTKLVARQKVKMMNLVEVKSHNGRIPSDDTLKAFRDLGCVTLLNKHATVLGVTVVSYNDEGFCNSKHVLQEDALRICLVSGFKNLLKNFIPILQALDESAAKPAHTYLMGGRVVYNVIESDALLKDVEVPQGWNQSAGLELASKLLHMPDSADFYSKARELAKDVCKGSDIVSKFVYGHLPIYKDFEKFIKVLKDSLQAKSTVDHITVEHDRFDEKNPAPMKITLTRTTGKKTTSATGLMWASLPEYVPDSHLNESINFYIQTPTLCEPEHRLYVFRSATTPRECSSNRGPQSISDHKLSYASQQVKNELFDAISKAIPVNKK